MHLSAASKRNLRFGFLVLVCVGLGVGLTIASQHKGPSAAWDVAKAVALAPFGVVERPDTHVIAFLRVVVGGMIVALYLPIFNIATAIK